MPNASSSSVRCRSDIINVGGGPREPPESLAALPDQLHAQLHLAAAACELPVIQEQVGSNVRIGGAQRVIHPPDQHTRLKDSGLCERVASMIEGVEGIDTELQCRAFCQLRILEQPQVPHIHPRGLKLVASHGGEAANFGLHIAGIGVLCDVTATLPLPPAQPVAIGAMLVTPPDPAQT